MIPADSSLGDATAVSSAPDLSVLPRERLEDMADAAAEIGESYRLLRKAGANVVGRVLAHQGTFYEEDHYPKGDVYDEETGSQYYYHAHRPESGEHGHFHTFLRAAAMPPDIGPAPYAGPAGRPLGADAVCHLVAISMDRLGFPVGLFTVNRWVTGDAWYAADDVIRMLDFFGIDHANPSWPANRWITAMLRLFRPQIEALIVTRDIALADWMRTHPGEDVFEDRALEIASHTVISVDEQIAAVAAALKGDPS